MLGAASCHRPGHLNQACPEKEGEPAWTGGWDACEERGVSSVGKVVELPQGLQTRLAEGTGLY